MGREVKRIHSNQALIKANKLRKTNDPVITVEDGRMDIQGHEVILYDAQGEETARVIYDPQNPLLCGACVWIETSNEVDVIERSGRRDPGLKSPLI